MKSITCTNLKKKLINLSDTLYDCLCQNKLCLAKLNHDCEKFKSIKDCRSGLKKAKYVIFSQDMKDYHCDEKFLFIDETGEIVDEVCGNEFWLYDMIEVYEIIPKMNYNKRV